MSSVRERVEIFWATDLPKPAQRALESGLLTDALPRLTSCTDGFVELELLGHDFNPDIRRNLEEKLGEIASASRAYQVQQNAESAAAVSEALTRIELLLHLTFMGAVQTYTGKITPLLTKQAELEESVTRLREATETAVERAAESVTQTGTGFRDAIERLRTQAQEFLNEQQTARDHEIGTLHRFADEERQRWRSETETFQARRAELESALKEVEERLGLVRQGPAAAAYQLASDHERRAADFLRYVALGLMLIVAGFVAYSLQDARHPLAWTEIALRFGLAFTLLIPAGYASREAARHRDRSEDYRLRGLGVLAVQNYIHDMPKDDAVGLKKSLAKRLLGAISPLKPDSMGGGTADVIRLIREAARALQAREKAAK
ncbi:hypothetical protein [Longimicrobium sp.]|uniref:hypothetical protein n=1 Tax=Longimicrobium sp. TaxID=2029185 RepID=UPI002C88107A|nr:hypothetical protein [Longimicrobium sp.]HSU17368.1 hypothetical protein [Longimicrobium sp.]